MHANKKGKTFMKTTSKALMFGVAMAAAGLGVLAAVMPAAPVVKLEPVVVTAQRLPVGEVVKLATVEVTASRAQVLAAQALEAGKQAAARATPNS
jgi:Flp pilus assembly protein CpaB